MMDKETQAVLRLKEGVNMSRMLYDAPLMITYSGGKDSDVIAELAVRHLKPGDFEIVNSHTTADAPETVHYIRQRFREWENEEVQCRIEYPVYKGRRTSMWDLIPQKLMPPTRWTRYCCEILKETIGKNRMVATGVRWEESVKRRKRGIYELMSKKAADKIVITNDNDDRRKLIDYCGKINGHAVNPIIDWTESDVWDYLQDAGCEGNPLYQCGFRRVGCVGCPLSGRGAKIKGFRLYPKYRQMYIHAFDRMLIELQKREKETKWKSGEDVMEWWTNPEYIPGQLKLADVMEGDEP